MQEFPFANAAAEMIGPNRIETKVRDGNTLVYHLFSKTLPTLVAEAGQYPTLVDFGSGDGRLADAIASHLESRARVIAYEPFQSPDPDLSGAVTFTHELPVPEAGKETAIVLCAFSLHHTKDPGRAIRDDIGQLRPRELVVAEFDFSGATPEDFQSHFAYQGRTFLPNQAGQAEIAQLGGLEAAYNFHRRFGRADFERFLTQAGYQIKEEITAAVEPYRFALRAEPAQARE